LREQPTQQTDKLNDPIRKSTKSAKKAVQKPIEEYDTPGTSYLSSCINGSWMKLRKYYRLMDQSPVYTAAVVLNSEHKWDYFRTNWEQHPEWIAQAEKSVEDLWLIMYRDSANSTEAEHEHGQHSSIFLPTLHKEPTNFDQWISRHKYKRPGTKEQDEYDQYLATEHLPGQQESEEIQSSVQLKSVDLCAFWARYEAQYPSLACMAFDILSIPAMSAECERVFSSAKLLLTDRRARMKEDTIEASECLRAWFQAGQFS
jgi:hAT family protein